MSGFFPIYIGVFFTLYTMSLSTEFKILNNKISYNQRDNELIKEEFKILNNKISYIQRDNELIKEELKSLNEKLNDRNF